MANEKEKVIEQTIKLPVRFDAENNHIFAADGGSIAWFPRNTHHPDWHRKAETGEYIAKCINEYADLKTRLAEAEDERDRRRAAAEASFSTIVYRMVRIQNHNDATCEACAEDKKQIYKIAKDAIAALADHPASAKSLLERLVTVNDPVISEAMRDLRGEANLADTEGEEIN